MIRDDLATKCAEAVYENPAPIVSQITVSDLVGNRHPQPWPGIVDTGADCTIVPVVACDDLGLSPRDWRFVRGFEDHATRRRLPRYYIQLSIDGLGEFPLLAFGGHRSSIVLGRDFLSGLILLIDNHVSWRLGRHSLWSRLVARLLALR